MIIFGLDGVIRGTVVVENSWTFRRQSQKKKCDSNDLLTSEAIKAHGSGSGGGFGGIKRVDPPALMVDGHDDEGKKGALRW